jgi:phage tail-like protein
MAFSFAKNLIDLLPPLYRTRDETGDLASFLAVPAPTLDELKDLIDRFPRIFDVDQCEERFLPYLAALVGMPFDATADPEAERRLIKEAVPIYRRKATIPAIRRSLAGVGWQGEIEETFRRALRIGSRSVLNGAKLPGEIYSLGVYRIVSLVQASGVRDALVFHHASGTRVFFWQWLFSQVTHRESLSALEKLIVRRVLLGELDEAFDLNRTRLGSCFHLTRKQRVFNACAVTTSSTLSPDFDHAAVCFASWHGRGDRMRL